MTSTQGVVRDASWDAYNARSLLDDEVAERFVPPTYFPDLIGPQHQLLIGPRGSGKTTLLRMLQRSSLARWQHQDAEAIRGAIVFEGVFVPADKSWGEQLAGRTRPDDGEHEPLANAIFTTHVLRSLVRTLLTMTAEAPQDRPALDQLDRDSEEQLAAALRRAWQLEEALPSFRGIRHELRLRLAVLGRAKARDRRDPSAVDRLLQEEWPYLDLMDELSNAVELVNDVLGKDDKRWGLLFDELEVAPAAVRRTILGSLRVPDPRLVMKVALSPYPGSIGNIVDAQDYSFTPREGHDFDIINLSHPLRLSIETFGRRVLDGLVRQASVGSSSPEKLFGRSLISTPAAQWLISGNAYVQGSKRMKELVSYIETDPSVRDYLRQNRVDVEQLSSVAPKRRAAHLRKIAPLISLREFYTIPNPGEPRRRYRQRKTFEFYTGLSMLLALSEGNPRSILYLFAPMLAQAEEGADAVSTPVQTQAIRDAIAAFRTLLKTIPSPTAGTLFAADGAQRSARRGLLDVLDHIGVYFADAVYATDFTPDPPGSFVVDSELPEQSLAAVESAVNIGALIFVPDEDGVDYFGSVRGKRFRLNYLLAAHHRLPLRLGRAVTLSRIFSESRPFPSPADRPSLFGGLDG